jgi:uncharacterized membrane protein
VALAVALALVLPRLERHFGWHWPVGYDAGTAQATLAAIAGGMITLTGFVLTAMTLMVQTVQAQSPRLLRVLDRTDRTPLLFGTFLATFTFALVVLSQVHSDDVPDLSLTLSVLLVLVSSSMFLRLLVTFRTPLTTGGLVWQVGGQLRDLIERRYPDPVHDGCPPSAGNPRGSADDAPGWQLAHSGPPGVLQAIDEAAAVRLAARAGGQLTVVPAVGDFVAGGAPLATGTGPPPTAAQLARVLRVASTRDLGQDPAYGIRVLVDIAAKALSAAVNDPTSAVQALDQLDDVMRRLAGRCLGDGTLADAGGQVRVRYPAPRWEALVALAFDEILAYGTGTLQVTRRLHALLDDLLAAAPPARRPPVADRLAALKRLAGQCLPDPVLAREAGEPDRQGIGSPRRDA